jgi:hypothetical protein
MTHTRSWAFCKHGDAARFVAEYPLAPPRSHDRSKTKLGLASTTLTLGFARVEA